MNCPKCNGKMRVTRSVPAGNAQQYQQRWRECQRCGAKFVSMEEIYQEMVPKFVPFGSEPKPAIQDVLWK